MHEKIGQLLLEKGLISVRELADAERIQREGCRDLGVEPGEKFGRIIIRKDFVAAMDVVRVLCEQRGITNYMMVGRYVISPELVADVHFEVARRFGVLPLVCLDCEGEEVLFAAAEVPQAKDCMELEKLIGRKIDWIEVKDRNFDSTVDRVYSMMAERGITSVRIGEVLVREGLVTLDEIEWALDIARRTNKRVGRVLMEEGLITEGEFFTMLARHKGLPLITAGDILESKEASGVASRLARGFAVFNEVVPFREEGKTLHIATSEADVDLTGLKKMFDCRKIVVNLVTISDMVSLLKAFYELTGEEAAHKGFSRGREENDMETLDDVWSSDSDPSHALSGEDLKGLRKRYENLVSNLLKEAIRRRSSDIHIEVYENFVAVRLRIDGLLYDARTFRIDKTNVAGVVNVIKVLSQMNIAERRLPQGGRFRKRLTSGEIFDFRVQSQPTLFGENIVIRLLNQSATVISLKELGFAPEKLDGFLQAVVNPSGLILITGPTGSGKTTTLYSVLDLLRRDTTKKIVTIEDPVEYSLPRIQQAQVLEAIGYDFASATRAFLREDPDVALVGEIRDEETARETIKLSQTGHLVFSTLHTNTALGATPRMLVLGVEPELLASEMLVVVAQRLARRICPECRVAYQPREELLSELYPLGVPKEVTFYNGAGCPECDGLGHTGRIVVAEFWFIDGESRNLISHGASEDEILRGTIGRAYQPILADALHKVHQGLVDIAELPVVLPMSSILSTAALIQEHGLVRPIPQAAG